MKSPNSGLTRRRLDAIIRVLCLAVEERIKGRTARTWNEYDLRKELVACILGSQVRHEMAAAAIENLDHVGLLGDSWWTSRECEGFAPLVFEVLSGQRRDVPNKGACRFAKNRTDQLTRIRQAFLRVPLSARLSSCEPPKGLRRRLVADIPGLGPKQTSMFLRNVGTSYDLAILDTHVARFMRLQGTLQVNVTQLRTLPAYE